MIDLNRYKTVCFVDSNILLEGLPLKDLRWSDIDGVGPILVLLLPTVLSEVDSKKKDGRLGPRARELNRELRPLVSGSLEITVAAACPRVDVSIATCSRIPWDKYDDLDRDEGDDRVVAEILNCRDVGVGGATLISQDTNPLIKARRHGVPTLQVSTEWMPPPEPSPLQKENARLKQQIAEFQKNEPDFDIRIQIPETPLSIYRVAPLTADEAKDFQNTILAAHPKQDQDNSFGLGTLQYDHRYDDRYHKYATRNVPSYVSAYHRGLSLLFNQVPIRICIQNIGKARAEHLLVEIRAIGGWLNDKPISFPISGISAPRPQPGYFQTPDFRNLISSRRDVDRHEVSTSDISRTSTASAQCEDFRQQQRWIFDGVLWLDAEAAEATIVIRITAANLTGEKTAVKKLDRQVFTVKAQDLVSTLGPKAQLKKSPAVQQIIVAAYKDERYSDVEHCDLGEDEE